MEFSTSMSNLFIILANSSLSSYFLLISEIIAFILKSFFLYKIITESKKISLSKFIVFIISSIIVSELLSDFAWILKIFKYLDYPIASFNVGIFVIRVAWAFSFVEFFALAMFIDFLASGHIEKRLRYAFYSIITALCGSYLLAIAFLNFHIKTNLERAHYEIMVIKFQHLFIFLTLVPSIWYGLKQIRNAAIPRILSQQLHIFLWYLIIPKMVMEIISVNPLSMFFPIFDIIITPGNHTAVALSTMITTYALYFSARKMMGLRFLNVHKHVQTTEKFNFINDFKETLERLSHVTNIQELRHITQQFFKEAFAIPSNKITFITRPSADEYHTLDPRIAIIENALADESNPLRSYLIEHKILITDEIEFTNFYENQTQTKQCLEFLQAIQADIFVPILERTTVAGYIIIHRNARVNFYSMVERDEMLVFVSYLSNLLYLLKHKNLDALLETEKSLREELHHKHQEINQYKESIRSFMRSSKERKIGIIFYKNKEFSYGNKAGQEFIPTNPFEFPQTPLSKALKRLIEDVTQFKTAQSIKTTDGTGKPLMLSAIESMHKQEVIITAYHPEVADIINAKLDVLKDPSDWDYLLYLETTASGRLINSLIPDSSESLLHFKVHLLKLSLSKKALLLSMPQPDLLPTVEIIHHISMRSRLETIILQSAEKQQEVALKLFGLNPLFDQQGLHKPLLETLSESGTIYIENIHYLSMETQQVLAEYLRYGYFKLFKSDRKVQSNVRIICSSTQQLETLAQKGLFCAALLEQIKETMLNMPSLLTLQNEDLLTLAEGFAAQALPTDTFNHIIGLQEQEKQKLLQNRPVSLQEFKTLIHNALKKQSIKMNLHDDIYFDPAFSITDPELSSIVRLGKNALKDQKMMTYLWNKFKNQTKIATLLGVNRSSVNRRCKQFHLIDEAN